jgi:hypothetical protein
MARDLLPDELRSRLPRLHEQDDELQPMVYARYFLIGTPLVWYVIEGQPEGPDFLFFGFVLGRNMFRRFLLSELEAARNDDGQQVEWDAAFIPGRLTDVVPPPDL